MTKRVVIASPGHLKYYPQASYVVDLFGIDLQDSSGNTLSDNTTNVNVLFGISLSGSSGNTLYQPLSIFGVE